jgi:hypothetical protein
MKINLTRLPPVIIKMQITETLINLDGSSLNGIYGNATLVGSLPQLEDLHDYNKTTNISSL